MISDSQIRALSRLMKAAAVLCWTIAIIGCIAALLVTYGQAVELSVIGSSIGQGVHSLNFSGDLNASIIQGLNNSSWQITASGAI